MKMFLKCVSLLAVCGCQHVGTGSGLTLTRDGASDYVIVQSAAPTEAEALAATDLAGFIKRSTGVGLPIINEPDLKDGTQRAIYVGQTRFAAHQGIDFATLGQEEWIIRAAGDSVIVAGGRPRGTLYGACEFLERFVGVRFLDAQTESVPTNRVLSLPAKTAIRAQPAFTRREIATVAGRSPGQILFQVRLRLNAMANADAALPAKYGYGVRFGSPYSTHTHPYYARAFPTNHPEYLALRDNGNRMAPPPSDFKGGWDGQVCMSNPDVRSFFAAKLSDYIKADRDKIAKAGTSEPFPILYSLVPADNVNKCVCSGCKAAAERYGAYSGLVLEFVNAIADEIARDYPDIRLTIGAYTFYADAPRGIKPRDNVIVYLAQLGAEFNTLPKRDALRSMDHPLNAAARRMWEDWAAIAPALGVHDYWTSWAGFFPHANIHGLAQTLRFYHRCGLTHFFVENELFGSRLYNFVDLQQYMASKLFLDPTQDEEPIIREFMDLYYGPAAPVMQRFLAYLEKRQEEEPGMLAAVPAAARKYFDVRFFVETDAFLAEAEALVEGDGTKVARVRQERLALDETLLQLWDKLSRERPLPFARDVVLARLKQGYEAAYAKYGGWGEALKQGDLERLEYLRNKPPIPSQFEGRNVIDLASPNLNGGGQAVRGKDPDAAMGKAWRLDATMTGSEGRHDALPEFGLFQEKPKVLVKKVLRREELPADQKFHLYEVGRMKASPNMYFWAHPSWRLATRLFAAYDGSLPEQRTYDVYVSLKLEGPAYVPGSTRTNAFSIDRLILVEAAPSIP